MIRAVLLVMAVAGAAGCSGTSISASPVSPGRSPSPGTAAAALLHRATADRNGLTAATVEVTSGVTRLDVRVSALGSGLLTATTPVSAGERPAIVVDHNTAQVGLTSLSGGGGPADLQLVLSSGVRWTVQLDGGATSEVVDLRGGQVDTVSLGSGATRAAIDLPAQPGQMTFNETGGLSSLELNVPKSVSTTMHVIGGASSVQIGSTTHTGIAGGTSYTDPNYASASRRLAITLTGGVSSVRLRRP